MIRELVDRLYTITTEEQKLLNGNALDRALYTSSPRFLIDSARLLRKGEMITLRPHTRFIDFPAHQHNYIEMIYMVAGETRHIINGHTRLTLSAGELLMLNQHATHAIEAASRDDIAVNIIVLPVFFDAVLEQIGQDNILGSFLLDALRQQNAAMAFLHFMVADVQPVQLVLESMISSLTYHIPNARKINQVAMSLLFLHLLNASDRLQFAPAQQQGDGIVVLALREIEENYPTVTLSELAGQYACSLPYLSRTIKKATGHTFAQLLQRKRMEKAASLLKQTSLTVLEIIRAVGYQNSTHFYQIFEKTYGVTPHEYRKISSIK